MSILHLNLCGERRLHTSKILQFQSGRKGLRTCRGIGGKMFFLVICHGQGLRNVVTVTLEEAEARLGRTSSVLVGT